MIFTDAQGRPFAPPEIPAKPATLEQKITYMRAKAAWRDAIASCAHVEFDRAFRTALESSR